MKMKAKAPITPKLTEQVGDLLDRYDITDAELYALSKALRETVNTEGWVLVERLLDKFHRAIPLAAMREDRSKPGARSQDYYVGQVDFIEQFRALVRATAAQADEKEEAREKAGRRAKTMLHPGRGPLA